jgi:protein CpxP
MAAFGPIMRLDLSDAQRDQIKSIIDAERPDAAALERSRTAHEALHAAVTADTFDEGAIRAASVEVARLEADMAVAQAKLRSAVLEILTPEQRTQLKEMESRRR